MSHVCQDRRDYGLPWILAFIMLTAFTVATCVKQQSMVAQTTPAIIAMKQASIALQ